MVFYTLSILSLILTTIYLYFNKIVAKKHGKNYSFQIWLHSFIATIALSLYEISNNDIFINIKFAWIFIILIWLQIAIRTLLIEKVLKDIDAWYFEMFMKFWFVFIIFFEYLFLNYKIPLIIYLSFLIFFIWIIITLRVKSDKWLNLKNVSILIFIALLFSIDPFLTRYLVENGYLSLSLNYIFGLWLWTIFIWFLRPRTIKFKKEYFKDFFPLAMVRMIAVYLAWKAILIWSPTIVELIKSCSFLLLFIVPIFIEKKMISLRTWFWIILSFVWVLLIIAFR